MQPQGATSGASSSSDNKGGVAEGEEGLRVVVSLTPGATTLTFAGDAAGTTSTSTSASSGKEQQQQQQRPEEPGVKELSMMVSNGADVSLVAAALPSLQRLTLLLPPSLRGVFEARPPDRHLQLPPLQLAFGQAPAPVSPGDVTTGASSSGASSGGPGQPREGESAALLRRLRHLMNVLEDVMGGDTPGDTPSDTLGDVLTFASSSEAAAAASAGARWQQQGQLEDDSCAAARLPLWQPHHRHFHFRCLKTLYVGSLAGVEGPWEPSVAIGDMAAAAIAAGCPCLTSLQLSGVLALGPGGLVALRGLKGLRSLGLEHWTSEWGVEGGERGGAVWAASASLQRRGEGGRRVIALDPCVGGFQEGNGWVGGSGLWLGLSNGVSGVVRRHGLGWRIEWGW
jgi:hypothetical protein